MIHLHTIAKGRLHITITEAGKTQSPCHVAVLLGYWFSRHKERAERIERQKEASPIAVSAHRAEREGGCGRRSTGVPISRD